MLEVVLWPFSKGFHYFLFGATFVVYLYVLFTKRREKATSGNKHVYLNVFFQDPKECIRSIVRSKVPKNYPVIRALAKRAAVVLLEKGIVERVAQNLCSAVPERLGIMGVKCSATVAYTHSAFVCIEVTLVDVDLLQFLSFNAGKETGEKIVNFLEVYGLPAITQSLRTFLLNFMANKLLTQLPATMKEKLYNKMNAEVELIACPEEDQGPFLVQTIYQLNLHKPATTKEESTHSRRQVNQDETYEH